MARQHNPIFQSSEDSGAISADDGWVRISDTPANPPEETERVEVIVKRVLEEHAETLEKLAAE